MKINRKLNSRNTILKMTHKSRLVFLIIYLALPFLSIGQNEEIIKDFVVGFSVSDKFRFDEFRRVNDSETTYYIGLFLEHEIKKGFTNEVFFSKSRRDGFISLNLPKNENSEEGYLHNRLEMKEESFSIRNRVKYRFFNRDIKPFIGLGIGIGYVYNTSKGLDEIRDGNFFKEHLPKDFITFSVNGGTGLDWYAFDHLFISLSLESVRIFGYQLERQYPSLKELEVDLKREKRDFVFLRLGIGYNFYN